jgi:hypothetical protein
MTGMRTFPRNASRLVQQIAVALPPDVPQVCSYGMTGIACGI